ncbi:hypothetical protein Moror_823 [Moniliophthora roreri MCA 2997]|uniref:DUF4470 domain-containing protein n=1 Tax=Moniliophthora roreri (strain MCA 2997) TaxID=1381753 RepID=V2WSK6_MONRO|nr:hypothetical protein Moror_823 [Moniliophthora roreri MCA 2997]KAI3600039.1 hypothetical protein WG66_011085 [Moniliophthora roreri]
MSTASQLKDDGNKAFRARLFSRAEKLYSKAEQIDPLEPFYPSNLSAALFEQARYVDTIKAIARSYSKISEDSTKDKLIPKLSTRLAKSLSLSGRNGTLTPQVLAENAGIIRELGAFPELQDTIPECKRAWQEWRRVERNLERVKLGAKEAWRRLASIPIRKRCPQPSVEFYAVGHDEPMSILEDWGPEDELKRPLDLHSMSNEELGHIAIFFAGVGDARHVLASVIGLNRLQRTLDEEKKRALNVHFTLNDIHPQALARDLCLFALLDQVAHIQNDSRIEAELRMTLLCMWMGLLLPKYCLDRLKETMSSLKTRLQKTPPDLPSWLYVVPSSIPVIIRSLDFWNSATPKHFTIKDILLGHERDQKKDTNSFLNNPVASSNFRSKLEESKREREMETRKSIEEMPDEQIIGYMEGLPEVVACPGTGQPAKRRKWLAHAREEILQSVLVMKENNGFSGPLELVNEEVILSLYPVFIPPSVLRSSEHPSVDKLWNSMRGDRSGEIGEVKRAMLAHILKYWKPNITLESKTRVDMTTDIDSIGNIVQIDYFNDRMKLYETKKIDADCPSYSIVSIFFDAVNDSLAQLSGHIKLEILLGEYNGELIKMRNGDDVEDRPESFPRQYTRMWLSNIPDYIGGPLAIAILTMPSLQDKDYASVAGNCLLNTSLWDSGEHYVFNYTHLDCKEFERFFGSRIVAMTPDYGVTEYAHSRDSLPLPVEQLPSRAELWDWLTRTLLGIIAAGSTGRDIAIRVQFPHTLTIFIWLLIRLHQIGYPSHWLSDYLHTLVHDQLITEVVEYRGHAPIPMSHKGKRGPSRKLNLDPWRIEFETLLALTSEALPILPPLPDDFAQQAMDIATFEAPTPHFGFVTMSLAHGFHTVFMLIIHRSGTGVEDLTIPEILERRRVSKGDVHIVTAVDQLALGEKTIRWRMSRPRMSKMQQEKWELSVYRHDVHEYSMNSVPITQWKEVKA